MASLYWQGNNGNTSSDQANMGDWSYDNAGGGALSNWRIHSTGAASAVPAAGDTVYIDTRAYYSTSTLRYADITAGLVSGVSLNALYISSGYSGNIGTASQYLEVDVANAAPKEMIIEGSGIIRICNTATYDLCIVQLATGGILYMGCDNLGERVTTFIAKTGTIYLGDYESDVTTVGFVAGTLQNTGATITGDADCTPSAGLDTIVNQTGGTTNWNAKLNNPEISGGTFNWGTLTTSPGSNAYVLTGILTLRGSGVFNWTPLDGVKSVIPQFEMYGPTCILDTNLTLNEGGVREIGTAAEVSKIWAGEARFNNPYGTIQFAGTAKISVKSDGSILIPQSASVTF